MNTMEMAEEAEEVGQQVYDLLAGRGPPVQGAICADILARWLAGHSVPGDKAATDEFREKMLKMHIEVVRRLIPVCEKDIHGE
jgi:hypothetical protein